MQTDSTDTSIFGNLRQAAQSTAQITSKLLSLAALEGRMAGLSFFNIIGLLFICSFLLFAAWLSLMVAAVIWLVSLHLQYVTALLIIAGCNLFLLIPMIYLIKASFTKMSFPATRRQLKFSHSSTQSQDAK